MQRDTPRIQAEYGNVIPILFAMPDKNVDIKGWYLPHFKVTL